MTWGSARRRNRFDLLRPVRRSLRGIEAWQTKRFGRSVLSVVFRTPVLVLVTTGRRTGAVRETTLAYQRLENGDLVVIGGAGGQRRLPDWVANLRAEPRASVIVDGVATATTAREALGAERDRRWADARQLWSQIDTYEQRAGRPVPVFVLCTTPPIDA